MKRMLQMINRTVACTIGKKVSKMLGERQVFEGGRRCEIFNKCNLKGARIFCVVRKRLLRELAENS